MNHINRLAIIGAFRALGGSIIWPFTGYALYTVFNFPLSIVSIYYLIQAVFSVLAYISGGYITDFLGRIKAMIISILLSSLFLLLSFLFYHPLLVASFLLLQSFFNNVYNVANTTLVGDINKGEFKKLVSSFSRVRVGINAGWAFGPLIGSIIFEYQGFRQLLLISSFILLIPLIFVFSLPDFKGIRRFYFSIHKEFAKFLLPTFLTFMLMSQLGFSLLTFYTEVVKLSVEDVGFLFMINGLLIVILQDIIGKFLKVKTIILGMFIYSFSYLAVAFITSFIFACIDVVFITLAEMIVSPLSQAIASSLTKDEERGREMGVYGMVTALGRLIGSSYASYLMSFFLFTPLYLWFFISILGFLSIPLYLLSLKRIETNG
ncbi:MFS transporter [Sulfurisphaera javensis]|uniref:MFS transporter n=1 Tax=Sulfurisphaera javensis TaxID=2049879 RepID=A0AAT9GPV2_9CREN